MHKILKRLIQKIRITICHPFLAELKVNSFARVSDLNEAKFMPISEKQLYHNIPNKFLTAKRKHIKVVKYCIPVTNLRSTHLHHK